MTGFAVDVAALQGLPPLLDRLGQDAAAGKQYLQDNTTIEYGVGLLNTVKGNHEQVVRHVRFFLEDIATYTAAQTSSALRQALRYYTDTASAARLDSTYRGALVDRSQFLNYYRHSSHTPRRP